MTGAVATHERRGDGRAGTSRPAALDDRSAGSRGAAALLSVFAAALLVAGTTACEREAPPRHFDAVVLVVIDTLRADHLGAFRRDPPHAPHIGALARQSTVFDHAFAPSPWTAPSMGSLLTGHWPSRHRAGELRRNDSGQIVLLNGRKVFARPDPALPTLAALFADAGFATAAVMTNEVLSPGSGFEAGFADYRFLGRETRGPEVTAAALEWLDAHDGAPFFLLVHYFDPHLPYSATGEFAARYTHGLSTRLRTPVETPQAVRDVVEELRPLDRRYLSAAYDEEIALVDDAVGDLVAGLRARGLFDRSLFVLTSDHGEELLDHGGFEHGHALYQELLHVPLIVHAPGWLAPGVVQAPVSLVDVFSTLVEAAALGGPEPATLAGRSLAGVARRASDAVADPATVHAPRSLLAESLLYGRDQVGLIEWPYKLVVDHEGAPLLFDLSADPGEQRPLDVNGAEADRAQRMRAKLEAMRADARAERPPRIDRELDDETQLQLGALGYLEPS